MRRAWEKENINEKWAATRWAKKIEAREKVCVLTGSVMRFLLLLLVKISFSRINCVFTLARIKCGHSADEKLLSAFTCLCTVRVGFIWSFL